MKPEEIDAAINYLDLITKFARHFYAKIKELDNILINNFNIDVNHVFMPDKIFSIFLTTRNEYDIFNYGNERFNIIYENQSTDVTRWFPKKWLHLSIDEIEDIVIKGRAAFIEKEKIEIIL